MLKFGIKNNDKMKIKKSKHEITMVMVFVIFTATCLSTFLERKASKTLPPSRGKHEHFHAPEPSSPPRMDEHGNDQQQAVLGKELYHKIALRCTNDCSQGYFALADEIIERTGMKSGDEE